MAPGGATRYKADYIWFKGDNVGNGDYNVTKHAADDAGLSLDRLRTFEELKQYSVYQANCLILFTDEATAATDLYRRFRMMEEYSLEPYRMVFVLDRALDSDHHSKNEINPFLFQVFPGVFNEVSTPYPSTYDALKEVYNRMEKFSVLSVINQNNQFKNSLEFSPEHKQAGIQILNYFQETLNQKFPDNEVTVRIGQKGNRVTMEIVTPDGYTELYEKALEEYGLVVTGQKPVEEYLPDKLDQMALEFRLQNISTELEYTNKLLTMKD
ncbi:MAG: hypothetical protein HEP71_27710 [Roseivirga sp.]|nr:hypothetical protein [Roseivirga sp.]